MLHEGIHFAASKRENLRLKSYLLVTGFMLNLLAWSRSRFIDKHFFFLKVRLLLTENQPLILLSSIHNGAVKIQPWELAVLGFLSRIPETAQNSEPLL